MNVMNDKNQQKKYIREIIFLRRHTKENGAIAEEY